MGFVERLLFSVFQAVIDAASGVTRPDLAERDFTARTEVTQGGER